MFSSRRLIWGTLTGALFLFLLPRETVASTAPHIVVTLPPLHSLVSSVTEGRTHPVLLLKGPISPHTALLRTSDIQALKEADLVVWVGPSFECFLRKTLSTFPQEKTLTLLTSPSIRTYPQRYGCDHHTKQDLDGHLWLDPLIAIQIVNLVTQRLEILDPSAAALYKKNATTLIARLQMKHQMWTQRLRKAKCPFFVLHDAYQYFEKRYGLRSKGILLLEPEIPLGGKQLHHLIQMGQSQPGICIFLEPTFKNPALEHKLTKSGFRLRSLDPLGVSLTAGPTLYIELMEKIVAELEASLCDRPSPLSTSVQP